MSKPLKYEILYHARQLITDPDNWVQHKFYANKKGHRCRIERAKKFCAVGAIQYAAWTLTGSDQLKRSMFRAKDLRGLMDINALRGHTGVLHKLDEMLQNI
jgi:hypothetical protein